VLYKRVRANTYRRGYVTDFDFGALFEIWNRYSTYTSLEDEMQAIAAGGKPMSFFAFPDADMNTDELYLEIARTASKLNLLTIRRKDLDPEYEGPIPHTYLFVIRDEQEAWRVPAFLFAMKVGWSGAIDELISRLLGYTDREIQRWREDRNRFHVNSKGLTVLFLMSSVQAASVRMLGGRAIDPKVIVSPITAFYNLYGKVLRSGASNLIPIDCRLLRASVDHGFVQTLFPVALIEDPMIEVAVCKISEGQGTDLNAALRSNFQFLGPDGWYSAKIGS
jgi:hypothetical protein